MEMYVCVPALGVKNKQMRGMGMGGCWFRNCEGGITGKTSQLKEKYLAARGNFTQ